MAVFRPARHSPAMSERLRRSAIVSTLRAHPVITSVILASALIGVAVGIVALPDDWSLIRKIAGGAVGGAGCGLLVTAPRIVG